MNELQLSVREIEENDISLIADYWLLSDDDFLVSMGVDLQKMPLRQDFENMLEKQINTPIKEKMAYALIWEVDDSPVGHSNVNNIVFGKEAVMHLHLWKQETRKKGIGTKLVKRSLPFYFNTLKLEKLICEPYALNPAPNRTLEKAGFEFIKKYVTIPGMLNFEQEVNRWEMSRTEFEEVNAE